MSAFATELAVRVRGLVAESADVNQSKIATAIGKSQGYVSPRMTGKEPWTTWELDKIAELLNMSGPEFLTEVMKRSSWLADSVTVATGPDKESRRRSPR